MSTLKKILIGVAVCAGVLCLDTAANAQDVQITGPLAGAEACRGCRVYRAGRFQLQPTVAFTLQDEYSRTLLAGGQLNYHLNDWLAIGAWGGFGAVHLDTGLTDQIATRGQTTDRNVLSLPDRDYFPEQIGQLSWVAAGQVSFIPLRGKLALFQKLFIDADFYVFAGAAAVGVEERADVDARGGATAVCGSVPNPDSGPADECVQTQVARSSRVAIAPTFGAGLMLYLNDFLGLSFEWRGLPFAWNTSGTDESGNEKGDFPDRQVNASDQIFHFNHMVALGLAIYLPTDVGLTD